MKRLLRWLDTRFYEVAEVVRETSDSRRDALLVLILVFLLLILGLCWVVLAELLLDAVLGGVKPFSPGDHLPGWLLGVALTEGWTARHLGAPPTLYLLRRVYHG